MPNNKVNTHKYMPLKKWLLLETRMIIRSPVTIKNIISLLLFIGVIVINKKIESDINSYLNIYSHLFFLGGFSLTYGQNYYAIHSSHFPVIINDFNSLSPFLLAKSILLAFVSFLLFLILCGIFYTNPSSWIFFAGYFIYASTFLTFLTLFFGTLNHRKIVLNNKNILANLNNSSKSQFIIGFFYFIPPTIILLANRYLNIKIEPSFAISAVALVCLTLSFPLFLLALKKLKKEKYSLYKAYSN